MTVKITYSELIRKLDDPDLKMDDLARFFIEIPNATNPFSPSYKINEELVELPSRSDDEPLAEGIILDWGLDLVNAYYARKRQRKYEKRIREGWQGLRLVAEGDSWFQYPFGTSNDVIDFLEDKYAIYCVSAAGDEFENMISAPEKIVELMRSTQAHGFLFSGGGNDIAGDELKGYLRKNKQCKNPQDFVNSTFDEFVEEMKHQYRSFIDHLKNEIPNFKMFYHGYDHAIPVSDGKWLGPNLHDGGVPEKHWQSVIKWMIDRYNDDVLKVIASEYPDNIVYVDCRGAVNFIDNNWRDELHAKVPGCEEAARRFNAAISQKLAHEKIKAVASIEFVATMRGGEEEGSSEQVQAPDFNGASSELLQEGELIPDEDIGLEDAIGLDRIMTESPYLEGVGVPNPYWPQNDENAPDYSHLTPLATGNKFTFTSADMELLISANHFEPHSYNNLIVFALRGARLQNGHQIENKKKIDVVDIRPDHVHLRCVIGIFDRHSGRFWAYTGSTVPNKSSMRAYYRLIHHIPHPTLGRKNYKANMLPTGCYLMRRGGHGWKPSVGKYKVPKALRLSGYSNPRKDGAATVLRTSNDCSYGLADKWDNCVPNDNIHPAFSTVAISSAGCINVRGSNVRYSSRASAQWARFLKIISKIPANDRIDFVLMTGAEASIATKLRKDGLSLDKAAVKEQLERLRGGSVGGAVEKLQGFLTGAVDGVFGPKTKVQLARKQVSVMPIDKADGIYSPVMDGLFQQNILTSPSFEIAGRTTGQIEGLNEALIANESEFLGYEPKEGETVSAENVLRTRPDDEVKSDNETVEFIGEAAFESMEASRTTPQKFRVEPSGEPQASGTKYFVVDEDNHRRFYVAKATRYGSRRGLVRYSNDLIYDRLEAEKQIGAWAHYIWPTVMAEGNGRHITINSYDRAQFTWGFYQLAAHTAGDNLILLMRELLKLPSAQYYFPDLRLDNGKVAQVTSRGLRTLEREVRVKVGSWHETQIPDFMKYLNPSSRRLDNAEVIATARFIDWARNDPEMLATTVRVSVEIMRRKAKSLDKRFGLVGKRPELALWISDMYHQGRGSSKQVRAALKRSGFKQQLKALSKIDTTGKHHERLKTVKKYIQLLMDEKRFDGIEVGRGELSFSGDLKLS